MKTWQVVILVILIASFLPIWRNPPAKERLNFWQFAMEEPFKSLGIRRPHITTEEAVQRYEEARLVVEPYRLISPSFSLN